MRGTHTRLRGRIPASGAPAPRSGASPILAATPAQAFEYPMLIQGLARVLAQGFVAHLANIRDIGCGSLRALSQNRDSASRVSSC